MVPSHRHQQVGGLSTQRGLWIPEERELGIETDTDRIYIGRDGIAGGVPAVASAIEVLVRVNGVHSKTVGMWLLADMQLASNDRPVGVVVETGSDYYVLQVSGIWRNSALPGNVGDAMFLQVTGLAGATETDIFVGYRVSEGIVITSGSGLTRLQKEAIEQIDNKVGKDELYRLVVDELIDRGAFEAYTEGGDEKLRIPDSMVEDSLVHAGIIDADTGGPGTAFGGRKTVIQITNDIEPNTPIKVIATIGTNYITGGDNGGFPDTEAAFNESDKIRVVFDRVAELVLGTDVIFYSSQEFTLNFKALAGTMLVVFS